MYLRDGSGLFRLSGFVQETGRLRNLRRLRLGLFETGAEGLDLIVGDFCRLRRADGHLDVIALVVERRPNSVAVFDDPADGSENLFH